MVPTSFFSGKAGPVAVNGAACMPLSGVPNVDTLHGNRELGKVSLYRSDRYGFRNQEAAWENDTVDAVTLGDSFTQGFNVDDGDTFASLLQARFPRVLNLAYAGDGPLALLATLAEYAGSKKPRTVLWFHYEGNDLDDLGREQASPLARYLEAGYTCRLMSKAEELGKVVREVHDAGLARSNHRGEAASLCWDTLTLQQFRGRLKLALSHMRPPEAPGVTPRRDLTPFKNVLRSAKERVAGWGGKLYFVYLPSDSRLKKLRDYSADENGVLSIVEELGIPYVNVATDFVNDPDPLRFVPFHAGEHYNAQGNAVVIRAVCRMLDSDR
jgi:hypothetical protein